MSGNTGAYLVVLADIIALSVIVAIFQLRVPEQLDSHTWHVERPDDGGVPQFARVVWPTIAAVFGLAAILASALAPFPALHGPMLLLTAPLWQRRVRADTRTQFGAPTHYGLEAASTVLYYTASLAILIGLVRLGPD